MEPVKCPVCGEVQFSVFDKMYTEANGKCVDCTPADQLEDLAAPVFKKIEEMFHA